MPHVFRAALACLMIGMFATAEGAPAPPDPSPVAVGHALSQSEIATLLKKVEKRVRATTTLQVDFVQEKHLSLFADTVVSNGRLLFAPPDRLRWEILEPFHSLLVVCGDDVAKFTVREGKLRKLNLGGADAIVVVTEQLKLWHQGKFAGNGDDFTLQAHDLPGEVRLRLEPKGTQMRRFIEAFEISLEKKNERLAAITVHEGRGDKTVIRFVREQRDPTLEAALFDLTAPRLQTQQAHQARE